MGRVLAALYGAELLLRAGTVGVAGAGGGDVLGGRAGRADGAVWHAASRHAVDAGPRRRHAAHTLPAPSSPVLLLRHLLEPDDMFRPLYSYNQIRF